MPYGDLFDLQVPQKKSDIPISVHKYLMIEHEKKMHYKKLMNHSLKDKKSKNHYKKKHCYIPVTHVLEYSREWDNLE